MKRKLHSLIGDKVKYELTQNECIKAHRDYFDELRKKFSCCQKCNREINLTLDHIIPKTILADFGYDVLRFFDKKNLQILCRPCNALKTGRLDFSNPKTKKLLIKYLKMLDFISI